MMIAYGDFIFPPSEGTLRISDTLFKKGLELGRTLICQDYYAECIAAQALWDLGIKRKETSEEYRQRMDRENGRA